MNQNSEIQDHWEKVYQRNREDQLGWYEKLPVPSLDLIESCHLNKNARILIVGAGTTTLVDELLKTGYTNIIANDISTQALEKIRKRLGNELSAGVRFIVDDLTKPSDLLSSGEVDLWHDRAVLHFFTEPQQQEAYFKGLNQLVRIGGYSLIASFNLNGAEKCSGLSICRYDEHLLSEKLGKGYKLVRSFDYTHMMPDGQERAYVYTLFRRTI